MIAAHRMISPMRDMEAEDELVMEPLGAGGRVVNPATATGVAAVL